MQGACVLSVGIDRMGMAFPGWRVSCRELAEARGVDADKVLLGLGVESFAVPMPWQDAVTLAADALDDLVAQGTDLGALGRIVVATESALDGSKPIAAWLHGMFGLDGECEAFDVKFACVGGNYALFDTLRFVASTGLPAVVVATDIALYGRDGSAECTQGAGAVALLVTREPGFLAIEPECVTTCTRDEDDFFRPFGRLTAVVRGRRSVDCYLSALSAVDRYRQRFCPEGLLHGGLDRIVFHAPYPGLPRKALARLLAREAVDESTGARLCEGVEWSVLPCRRIGNVYTASVFLALAGLAAGMRQGAGGGEPGVRGTSGVGAGGGEEVFPPVRSSCTAMGTEGRGAAAEGAQRVAGTRVGVYTYGSGSGSRFFVGEMRDAGAAVEHLAARLAVLPALPLLSIAAMEAAFYERRVPAGVEPGPGWAVACEDETGYRRYVRRG